MTAFDVDTLLRQPRLAGLALSPDGRRLTVGVSTPAPDGERFRSALWSVDPAGEAPPRQLTRAATGESQPAFAPDGSLLFVSARPDPDAEPDGDPPAALWVLPAEGGEARLLFAPAAGVTDLAVARGAGDVVVTSSLFPGVDGLADDRAKQQARDEAGVGAQLFTSYPVRHWDSYLGPREPACWRLTDAAHGRPPSTPSIPAPDDPPRVEPPRIARGRPLEGAEGDLAPDGRIFVTTWQRSEDGPGGARPEHLVADLVAIDVISGRRRTLLADGRSYGAPAVSPDGSRVVCVALDLGDPDRAADVGLVVVDLDDGTARDLAPGLDLWPSEPRWSPDGDAVVVTADERGHRPVFRIDLADDTVTRLTAAGAYTDVCVAPDGIHLYALEAAVGSPHRPVRLTTTAADQTPVPLPSPAGEAPSVAEVERLTTTTEDGTEVGSWLVLPRDASGPVPLVVFIHGGPLGTWNTWTWRWNPHVLADRGFAVLLPDPALSTGYGRAFVERGWGRWGAEPYSDLLAAVDAAAAHDAVDADRLAAAGGSFGGYMANWVAGHTDRFRAIVTHASLWALEGFHGTTDLGLFWEREFGDPYRDASRFVEHSPNRHVAAISTPMLVVHGERDFRVPISEALTLWTDLSRHGVDARFLYFPDENHWVLKPQNSRLWYQTVIAFLAEHLLDEPFERPALL
jgi:dipeptidyl aminopeptidase/acylaminoacyl peptidase